MKNTITNPALVGDKLLSRRALCDRWSVSTDFIRALEASDKLHPIKLSSRCLRYRLTEIEGIESGPTNMKT